MIGANPSFERSKPVAERPYLPKSICTIAWLLILFCGCSSAAAQYRFDVWTADNGLPQNVIRSIKQTPDGYLWIATFDGLARFDGVRFTVYNKSNSPGLLSNRFGSMYEDRSGDLWITTEGGGIARYHRGHFRSYGAKEGVSDNNVWGAFTISLQWAASNVK